MEEKRKNPTMKVVDKEEKEQKLTYEQLNNICSELYQQNQVLRKQLQEANLNNMFKRLDYLFKVVEYSNAFGDPEFIGNCIEEIKDAIVIKEPEKEEENG